MPEQKSVPDKQPKAQSEGAPGTVGKAKPADVPEAAANKTDTPPAGGTRPAADLRGGPRPPRDRSRGGRPGGRRFYRRKKVDFFSVNKIDDINYKDAQTLKQFIGDRGKILPRRHTGLSAMHQRKLKVAIKRARNIALLPFAGDRNLVTGPKVEENSQRSVPTTTKDQ